MVGQILPINPATDVDGPAYVVTKGKTPVLEAAEARLLIDGIRTDTLVGLRDRALIAILFFNLARISAVVGVNPEHVFVSSHRLRVNLLEKGGRLHEIPLHHEAEEYLRAYMDAADLWEQKHTPLFRSVFGKTGTLTDKRLSRVNAYHMIKRRARDVGLLSPICCHTGRATGITDYLRNGGLLEQAQKMAGHASPRTTKIYVHTDDSVTLDEVERIRLR